jgi:hypothetical protein
MDFEALSSFSLSFRRSDILPAASAFDYLHPSYLNMKHCPVQALPDSLVADRWACIRRDTSHRCASWTRLEGTLSAYHN